jgi:geranylgeranyl diphosphate synthase, type II
LEAVTRCAGIKGATNGQFLDLNPPDQSLATIQKIITQKTSTLFEIAFVFGWLFGGGAPEKLSQVQKCSHHLGMAFQTADDILDYGKSGINIASVVGLEIAGKLFEEELLGFTEELKSLGLWNKAFQSVVLFLKNYSKQQASL